MTSFRIFRKFYVFAFFLLGIFLYATLFRGPETESIRPRPVAEADKDKEKAREGNVHDVLTRISYLENEIASQRDYSDQLLQKLRSKYAKIRDGESEKPARKSVNSKELIGGGVKKKEKDHAEKLFALQNELQKEAHHGEVKSEELELERDGDNEKQKQEPQDVANGEVIDEPMKKGVGTEETIAVLVFVCDRPTVKRAVDKLLAYRPSEEQFPVIVSQDCGSHPATTEVLKAYDDRITHIMQPDLSDIPVPPKEKKMKGYYKIARHYGWALNYTFNTLKHDNVIIVEDDIEIASDFFEYFAATLPILKKDPTLWCVSAWNDNGKSSRINETAHDLLYRSDFFPGLGWMMTKGLWEELMVKWPRGYWDDWMREPAQRKNRACIRPEISRTSTFGKEGVSLGTYYMTHLRFIKLNDHFVPFKSKDLSYLLKDNYDSKFVSKVYSSQLVNSVSELLAVTSDTAKPSEPRQEYRLVYRTKTDFRTYAKKLELMEDTKAGVPRTAYRGVVPFFLNGYRCYLAPGANWESYQPN